MVTHMKTTLELPDALFDELKATAHRSGVPMRSVVEDALRRELERRRQPPPPFVLVDAGVGGKGIRLELADRSFADILELIGREHS